MIVIVVILLLQLGAVSKSDGRAVSLVARGLTVININVPILATRVIVYRAIRIILIIISKAGAYQIFNYNELFF